MIRSASWKTYAKVGLVIVALTVLHYAGVTTFLEKNVRRILTPIFLKARGVMSYSADDSRLVCAANQETEAQLKSLLIENTELRNQLNFKPKPNWRRVGADVIGRESTALQQIILINRGSDDGITIGQPAVSGNGILIGKIIKTNPDSAAVLLLTDNQSKIAATTLNQSQSLGVIEGGNGLSLRMKFIPRNETLAVGESIITSGIEKNMPRGLLIGTVAVIENESYQPFQQAILSPALENSKIFALTIILTE